jgi:hypothetical protein
MCPICGKDEQFLGLKLATVILNLQNHSPKLVSLLLVLERKICVTQEREQEVCKIGESPRVPIFAAVKKFLLNS